MFVPSFAKINRLLSYWADMIFILKFTKELISKENVGCITVLHLCTLSDDALYLYQELLKGYDFHTKTYKGA